MDIDAKPLIIAGVAEQQGALFLVIEVSAGRYVADQITEPYTDAAAAIERIQAVAKLHGDGETCDLWTDNRDILRLSLSRVGVNPIAKHSSEIQPTIRRYLMRQKTILAQFYELDDGSSESKKRDPAALSYWRRFSISLLTQLRDQINLTINYLQTTGGKNNGSEKE